MITPNNKLKWTKEFAHEQGLYWFYDIHRGEMLIKVHSGFDFYFMTASAPHRQVYNVPFGSNCLEAYFGDPRVVTCEELAAVESPPKPEGLMSCPFCGKEAYITSTVRKSPVQTTTFTVGCSTTHCRGHVYRSPVYHDRKDASKAWNTRR